MKQRTSLLNLSILTALVSSISCIIPVLTMMLKTSELASAFSRIELARPYLIGVTILALGLAWYQYLKKQPIDNHGSQSISKALLMQPKAFLGIVTVVCILLLFFSSNTPVFFPKSENPTISIQKVEFKIEGMTSSESEHYIISETNRLKGIIKVVVSNEKGNAIVSFDNIRLTVNDIIDAINSKDYKVISYKIISDERE